MVTFNKKYSNGKISVHWKPEQCIHSGNCARQMISVFDPRKKPWITLGGAETTEIIKTVEGCPSGALSWEQEQNNQD